MPDVVENVTTISVTENKSIIQVTESTTAIQVLRDSNVVVAPSDYMSDLIYDPGGVSANVFDLSNHSGNLDCGTF